MNSISILVIDDEPAVRKTIKAVLISEHMNATCAKDSRTALELLEQELYDLILLDIMMPGQDGFAFLKELRSRQCYIPVILLSGRDESTSQVKGLSIGADDYITKPFNKTVLISRIQAIIRRNKQYAQTSPEALYTGTTIQKGIFTLHLDTQIVQKGTRETALSTKEAALLYFFLMNPERLLTKHELFLKVWQSEIPDNNTILVYIRRLREKLEDQPSNPQHIRNVWGKGYQFFL